MSAETGLVEAWIQFYTAERPECRSAATRADLFWAQERLFSLCADAPSGALEIIDRILSLTDDENVISNLAAGPLESLLAHHGESVIADVEARAKASATFRRLLKGVWQNRMNNEVWSRVVKAASG